MVTLTRQPRVRYGSGVVMAVEAENGHLIHRPEADPLRVA